ncbi:MAG: TetR/AcrR family transcriptional regulator [Clostridium sp.]
MRISKDPNIRRQEIIDTAIKLFSKNGYCLTSMNDIAKEMNVVSGLCYRYFKSKEDLYKTVVNIYAEKYSSPIISLLQGNYDNIHDFFSEFSKLFIRIDSDEEYYGFFHSAENEMFHREIETLIVKKLEPHVINLFSKWQEEGLMDIHNLTHTVRFILYGQFPILTNSSISSKKKLKIIKSLIHKLLK